MNKHRLVWLDRSSYPFEIIRRRPFLNGIRWLIWASVIVSLRQRGRWQQYRGVDGKVYLVDTWCRFDRLVPK